MAHFGRENDKRIDQLTPNTNGLSGTDLIAIYSDNTTENSTISELTSYMAANMTGVNVTFSYVGVGGYMVTATGIFNPKPIMNLILPTNWGQWMITPQNDNTAYLEIFDNSGTPSNSLLDYIPFVIEVYP